LFRAELFILIGVIVFISECPRLRNTPLYLGGFPNCLFAWTGVWDICTCWYYCSAYVWVL